MKTIKFRIEPNSEQRDIIDQMIDANRIAYNNMLTACKIHYTKTKELPSVFDMNKIGTRMRHNSPYISKAYSTTLNETAGRVIKACEKTLGIHEKESGELDIDTFSFNLPDHHFPRYKSYSQFNSITYPRTIDYSVITEKKGSKKKRMLRLGKVPGLIRCYNQSTKFDGIMKTCTVKKRTWVVTLCIMHASHTNPLRYLTKNLRRVLWVWIWGYTTSPPSPTVRYSQTTTYSLN